MVISFFSNVTYKPVAKIIFEVSKRAALEVQVKRRTRL